MDYHGNLYKIWRRYKARVLILYINARGAVIII